MLSWWEVFSNIIFLEILFEIARDPVSGHGRGALI